MIVSRTPLRISFAGGGTDLPSFYRTDVGAVTGTTFNRYIYICVNRRFDEDIRASYSRTEVVGNVYHLEHDLIREALLMVGITHSVEVVSISDVPAKGTGLGSSSAYAVGLLKALYRYSRQEVSTERIAKEACRIEIDLCGKTIGKQDQYWAAYGGMRHIQFMPTGCVTVSDVKANTEAKNALFRNLLLLYTGISKPQNGILKEQSQNILDDKYTRNRMRLMAQLAVQAKEAIEAGKLEEFGLILHENWLVKKELAKGISTPDIDVLYRTARFHGATGGKILGAGGGGFLLVYAPYEKHIRILKAMPGLIKSIPIKPASEGSEIVYDDVHGGTTESTLSFADFAFAGNSG